MDIGREQEVHEDIGSRPARADLIGEHRLYWTELERLRCYQSAVMKYITTLTNATAENNALLQRMDAADDNLGAFSPQDRANALKKSAYFEAVISHCTNFAIRCNDTSEGYQLDPDVQALRNMEVFLQGIVRDPHFSSETRRDQGV